MSRLAALLGAGALAACGGGDVPSAADPPEGTPRSGAVAAGARAPVRTVAGGLKVPWGLAFLPGGDALVSERTTGRILRLAADGAGRRVVMRIPGVDLRAGEGGLLGLAVSPRYARDRLVYAYYTTSRDNRIVRFRLGGRLDPVLTGLRRGFVHNGGRIAFGPDGRLYAGVGDVGEPGLAQDPRSLNGKVLRLRPDGSVPRGNPIAGSPVWSLGHRNVQGLAWDSEGRLWASEFGQNAVDELNRIRPGRNYGWPAVEGRSRRSGGRYVDPVVTWRTSEASPSGVAIRDDVLYMAALRGEGLWRVPLRDGRAGRPRLLYSGRFGRLRTVEPAPRGGLWIATSNRDGRGTPRRGDDRIVRVPAR